MCSDRGFAVVVQPSTAPFASLMRTINAITIRMQAQCIHSLRTARLIHQALFHCLSFSAVFSRSIFFFAAVSVLSRSAHRGHRESGNAPTFAHQDRAPVFMTLLSYCHSMNPVEIETMRFRDSGILVSAARGLMASPNPECGQPKKANLSTQMNKLIYVEKRTSSNTHAHAHSGCREREKRVQRNTFYCLEIVGYSRKYFINKNDSVVFVCAGFEIS